MSAANEIKIPVKILVDKERKKVIFAEASHDFVDTLFSFLTLPMGTIVNLLMDVKLDSPAVSVGSLSSLYEGLKKLDPKHFWTGEYCKNMLLQPTNSSETKCQMLKVNMDGTEPAKYFICETWNCSRTGNCYYSRQKNATCHCGKTLNREISREKSVTVSDSGVFVTETTFIISDDLSVMPNLPSSCFELLNNAGIKDK